MKWISGRPHPQASLTRPLLWFYLVELKKQFGEHKMVLHSDQGVVYASKDFNQLLENYNITRSMSRAGTPTDNAAMEAINGWLKAEIFTDFHIIGDVNCNSKLNKNHNL